MFMLEEKPWYTCVEFWTAIIGSVGVIVLQIFGVELPTESLVALAVFIGYIFWSRISQRNKVVEAKADMYIADREVEIARLAAGAIPKDHK